MLVTHHLTIDLTDEEMESLEIAAQNKFKSVAEWIKDVITEELETTKRVAEEMRQYYTKKLATERHE